MSTYYKFDMGQAEVNEGTFYFYLNVGTDLQLQIRGAWDNVLQYQYDIIKEGLRTRSSSQPLLLPNGELLRTYDYIQYYLPFTDPEFDFEEWWNGDKSEGVPFDVSRMELTQAQYLINQRAGFCKELFPIVQKYKEGLRWNVLVEDNNGGRTSAVIQPGGWFRNQALNYSFKFISEKASIGVSDLPYVTMIIEVKDGQ